MIRIQIENLNLNKSTVYAISPITLVLIWSLVFICVTWALRVNFVYSFGQMSLLGVIAAVYCLLLHFLLCTSTCGLGDFQLTCQ